MTKEKNNKPLNIIPILPLILLAAGAIFVIVYLAAGNAIPQPLSFFLIAFGFLMLIQIRRQFIPQWQLKRSIKKFTNGKILLNDGHPFDAIKLWKKIIFGLPKDKFLEAIRLLEETYKNQNMIDAVQQVKIIKTESHKYLKMTENAQETNRYNRETLQAKAMEIQTLINALPTKPDQDFGKLNQS